MEAFLRDPLLRAARLSPDGRTVVALTTAGENERIILYELESGSITPILNFPEAEARLRWIEWASDTRLVFGVSTPNAEAVGVRARASRLFSIRRDGAELRHLGRRWPFAGRHQFEDDLLHLLPDDPDHILISMRPFDQRYPHVYRVNVKSGARRRVVRNSDRISTWIADPDGAVRAGVGSTRDEVWVIARKDAGGDFERIFEQASDVAGAIRPLGFGFEPHLLYVASRHAGDRFEVYAYDIVERAFGARLFAHPKVDVAGPLYVSRRRRVVTGIGYVLEQYEIHFFDEEAQRLQASIDHALPGTQNHTVSESRDGSRALLVASGDAVAPRMYVFLRDERRLVEIYALYPELASDALSPSRSVRYTARDGLEIPAILTLPRDAGEQRLPVIVMPHGGPAARSYRRFSPLVQLLASRGFAVFEPNFRGSTGYGARHEQLGFRRWGLEMQDDVTDGVRWLIAQGIADPGRIGIYGASYGGYAALMGLVKTPELFRCGASYAGVSDIPMLLADDSWYLNTEDYNVPRIGDRDEQREQLERTSPLRNVARFRVPLLLAHGRADSRVHVRHATRLADALRDAGKPVELMLFEDGTHGLREERHRIALYTRLLGFFQEHLAPVSPAPPGAAPEPTAAPSD